MDELRKKQQVLYRAKMPNKKGSEMVNFKLSIKEKELENLSINQEKMVKQLSKFTADQDDVKNKSSIGSKIIGLFNFGK